MSLGYLSLRAREVAEALARISRHGPVPAVGNGATSVGMTLMHALGMRQATDAKPRFNGLVVSARRGTRLSDPNRVNLFAQVPDWSLSAIGSSRELLTRHGYDRNGRRSLNCTVRARQPNNQGLYLFVDHEARLLRERHAAEGGAATEVVAWSLSRLTQRLVESHPESAWVLASSSRSQGREYFHFRYVQFTSSPRADMLPRLLESGTVTVDHLITGREGRVVEKGPLFKINPSNASALFEVSPRIDLMQV